MRNILEREEVGRLADSEITRVDKISAFVGRPSPLGATVYREGVNFSVFSKHAERVELLLFADKDSRTPTATFELNPVQNRTYHYWHTFVPGVEAGQLYAYRAHGAYAPDKGLRFDPDKILLDPYGKCIARPSHVSRMAASLPGCMTRTPAAFATTPSSTG